MKSKDLKERSAEDLRELEKSLAKDVFQARFKNFTNRLDDTSAIGKARKDLARVKTLIRQAELNSGSQLPAPLNGEAPKAEAKPAAKASAKSAKQTGPKTSKASKKTTKKTSEAK